MVVGDEKGSQITVFPKEQAVQLCKEGDQQLAAQELPLATAFYMAAFSCNALVAVEKVASLGKEAQVKVIATLEKWCQGQDAIPKVQHGNLPCLLLHVGIAAVFLSTVSPNNMAASLCKMDALLKLGRYKEVASRCSSLLNVHHCLDLVLTRALAQLLSRTQFQHGITDYLCAFTKHRDETVMFVRGRQKRHLQQIIQAFFCFISGQETGSGRSGYESSLSNCYDFLAAIAPEDTHVCQAQAAYLFEKHKYKECVAVYSKALEALSSSGGFWHERAPRLLVDRAAAYFSLGGQVQEMMRDLTDAFEVSLSLAKKRFDELFSAWDAMRVEKHARAAVEVEFIAYKEAVRIRPEVRSDSGKERLSPVLRTLRFLIQISPGAKRELSVRLADCYLLEGNIEGALEICNSLLESEQETYHNTLLALRGFCHLHAKSCHKSLQDFQKVIEHNSPHPSSCVKALCGRGLIRALSGSPFLTALDFITACGLKAEETSFITKSYIPWNQRGLLMKVLQEEGQEMLDKHQQPSSSSASQQDKAGGVNSFHMKGGDASGVHQLASLLLELDASDETSQLLCADALYQMDRVDEAQKILLVALSNTSQRSAILARLALLQLKKGFLYDCNQLLKKVIQAGDTGCFLTLVKVLKDEDRMLLQSHCHARAVTVLKNKRGENYIKDAILYLSFAITASGGFAVDSLLTRARCYGQLGQKKTAMFDFNAILKEDPENAQALSGRGFIHLALNQKKEAVHDLTSALQADPVLVLAEILSLKQEAQQLIHQWLSEHCRTELSDLGAAEASPMAGESLKALTALGKVLVTLDGEATKSHILYVDILAADGRYSEALAHLQESFGQTPPDDSVNSRFGMLQVKKGNVYTAAHILATLATKDYEDLGFLIHFLDLKERQNLAQTAAQEGNTLVTEHCHAKAVGYYSLAVLASNSNPRYLRQRATCLAHLKEYRKALKDMANVVQSHGTNGVRTQAGDFCFQGHLLMSLAEEKAAVKQYIKALQLEQSVALASITTRSNKARLSQAFLQMAQSSFATGRHKEAWRTAEFGLLVDDNNIELKKLKTRIQREASGCRVH